MAELTKGDRIWSRIRDRLGQAGIAWTLNPVLGGGVHDVERSTGGGCEIWRSGQIRLTARNLGGWGVAILQEATEEEAIAWLLNHELPLR